MVAIPIPLTTAELIDKAHEASPEKKRGHMGCSLIGHHCERWVWLSFRWAVVEEFEGRMRRLFRRGHDEEPTFIADLELVGVEFRDPPEEGQHRVKFGSFVEGSLDSIAERGIPEAPKSPHLVEMKTHSLKSFGKKAEPGKATPTKGLIWEGVKRSKPQHWAQMQLYMHGTGLKRALYIAVCKDDDRLYTERVRYDREAAESLLAKGQRLALAERLPEPCSGAGPDWWACKFCAAYSFCWEQQPTKEVHCRTCAHSTPTKASEFRCARFGDAAIPRDFQERGCGDHVVHPDLVPWKFLGGNGTGALYEIDGEHVRNGPRERGCVPSKELVQLRRKDGFQPHIESEN